MSEAIKLAFASCSADLIPDFLEAVDELYPGLPLYVVAEFPPPRGQWIPWHIGRSLCDNIALIRAAVGGRRIRVAAVLGQPRMPYWRMRVVPFLLAPLRTLVYNENFDHLALRPGSAPAIAKHLAWRTRNLIRWELRPGGTVYTWAWRLRHPGAFRRPLLYRRALLAGLAAAVVKKVTPALAAPAVAAASPAGVSVVIPSRNGRELLARLLPSLLPELAGSASEVIVVDNGSSDGTAEWLTARHPGIRALVHEAPMSFARAANAGIAAVRHDRTLLLNNDMVVEPGFVQPLLDAFARVPDLFCATAQILFPPGERRQETGKAVMPDERAIADFPITCIEPVEGENLTPVLYGSGGCSLYDTARLRALGGFDEIYEPAYVEDLDLGFRGWQRGWPTVFVAPARAVHHHRATTSRYHSEHELHRLIELNYLRFLARTVRDARLFRSLWRRAVVRLNTRAASDDRVALEALGAATVAAAVLRRATGPAADEQRILAAGSGRIAVFPGCAAQRRPVILIGSPYLPFPLSHGGAVRMYNLMRGAASEYDQVLVAFAEQLHTPPRELLEICTEIVLVRRTGSHVRGRSARPDVVEEFASPAFEAALGETIRKWKPAVAQLEFTQMAQYAGVCRPVPTILVEHDVTLDLYAQLLAQQDDWETRRQWERWVAFEEDAWRNVDAVVTMSRRDARLVKNARRVAVLENGVDLERFQPSSEEPDPARLLFIGSFAHLPNLLAIEWFLNEVWPRLRHLAPVFHVIAGREHLYHYERQQGRVRIDFGAHGLEVDGFVPDPRPAYRRATVVVAPLLASAGTNIKIMEAMAMGKAIVSTPGGINGLDLAAGTDLLVTADAAEQARMIDHLLTHPEDRRALETRARATAKRRYSWDRIASEQSRLYQSLVRT